jgi:hypothetical protein
MAPLIERSRATFSKWRYRGVYRDWSSAGFCHRAGAMLSIRPHIAFVLLFVSLFPCHLCIPGLKMEFVLLY